MSEWIVNAQIVSATLSSDNWVKVLWRTEIDGDEEWISSNFGPDFGLREKFYDRTGVGPKNLSSVEGRVFRARIYENSKGKLHVSPAELTDPNRSFAASASQTLTAPLGTMVGKVHVPPTNAPHEEFKKATEATKTKITNPIDDLRAVVKTVQTTSPIPVPVVPSAKSVAGYKGSDTKSLRSLNNHLEEYLNKDSTRSMESRLPEVVKSIRSLQAEIKAVLKNRK